jgi:hypothetical protein
MSRALGTVQRETRAALHTEVRLDRILMLAPRTRHAVALQGPSRPTSKVCPERSCAAGAGQERPRVKRKRPVAPLNATLRPHKTPPLCDCTSRTMARSKTSLRRPAKGCAFRGVPEAEDAGSKRNDSGSGLTSTRQARQRSGGCKPSPARACQARNGGGGSVDAGHYAHLRHRAAPPPMPGTWHACAAMGEIPGACTEREDGLPAARRRTAARLRRV